MFSVTETTMKCLKVSVPEPQQASQEFIAQLATTAAQEAENLIAQGQLFYLSCNGINSFPWPLRKDDYTSLYGTIEHFIYKALTTEGDAFISLLKNQIFPPKWLCTILLREIYVAVVMQNCELSKKNHQQLLEIINEKLKYYDESKNIFGATSSIIEDSTAKTLLSIYGYIQEGNQLSRAYLSNKVS